MSAERLREAAEVLRERTEVATPGSWESVPAGPWTGRIFGAGADGPGTEMVAKTSERAAGDRSNAEYIAAMHPGVALAIAAWLEATAEVTVDDEEPVVMAAVSVADAVLGPQS